LAKKLGDCYDVAGRMVMDGNEQFVLCHGLVTGQRELSGQIIGHAWCEIGDIVLDFANGKHTVMRKERYYEIGKIEKVRRYTQKQACEMMMLHKTFGPWDKEVETDWQRERKKKANKVG